jgi:two-component sensor histidine kinase
VIGRIHRQLHDPSGERLDMGSFLKRLGADLIDTAGKPDIQCVVDADGDIAVEPDAAVPLALIVAEAVANALEHGFGDRDTGRIKIGLRRREDAMIEVTVADDGSGLPPDFDIDRSDSLGLSIARTLAHQLGGTFTLEGGAGATARLLLPA